MFNKKLPWALTADAGRDGIMKLMQWSGIVLLAVVITMSSVAADTITLAPGHPDRYVVVKGDTLWDISGRFLSQPWRWPQVWKVNPQIKNPNLIYPGDVIALNYRNGVPELTLERGGSKRGDTVKLSPEVRSEPLDQAIPTIPPDAIQQFLTQTRPVALEEMQGASYIVANAGERLASAAGEKIYARGVGSKPKPSDLNARESAQLTEAQSAAAPITPAAPGTRYGIFRLGDPYYNLTTPIERPTKEDLLGYEGIYVGEAVLETAGDPATLLITRSRREALIGDRLLPLEERAINQNFFPHPPTQPIEGSIVSVVDGVTRIGQYQAVALNLGTQHGVEPGHVFAVFQRGAKVRDDVSEERNDTVQLPDEPAGIVMVFRTFERVSYALVMEASKPLRLYDVVRNP
ncbi:MAG: LysM domain-containing protein [Gammaproteobacteria bacterium]